jgi:alkylation response protein AidB-like acyl-CoA dehydrogenase
MTQLRIIEEQREFVEGFMRPAETLLPLSRLREGGIADAERWQELAGLGWLGISLPEELGDIGLGPVEEALAAQALGRHLVTPGYLATVIAARAALGAGQTELAAALARGGKRAAWGLTQALHGANAADADGCDLLLSIGRRQISLAPILDIVDQHSVHWSLPIQRVTTGAPIVSLGEPELLAFARLLGAATLAGIATQSGQQGLDYAKVREQFGQPIGAFQAVKHHCANMAIAAFGARELVASAAMALEDNDPRGPQLASAALNFSLRAARANAGTCIQIHGGMGFSAECDAHHFLKRSHLIEAGFGGIGIVRQLVTENSRNI